ncbi:MAG: PocR ligand-binding domain-containing protein [Elusimicrobiota bacterium]
MSNVTLQDQEHLIDGKYGIADLVDLDRLRGIFEKFTKATGFTIGFLDHPGLNILCATGWRDICTKFHRGCPAAAEICTKSNRHLLDALSEPGQIVVEACENGLVDCATPIIIKGKHIASLATGQLLLEPPDLERFKRQAGLYGFDERAYLAALAEIPVVSRETLRDVTLFLGEMAYVISEMGYTNLVIKEESGKLAREIVERKLAELEKEKLNSELTVKNREMENFLYVATHDLRSPLVNIQGFSNNLVAYLDEVRTMLAAAPLPPETRQALDKLTAERIPAALKFIIGSSRSMDALITTLLKVSRIGRVEMKPETLEMNALLKTILDSLHCQLKDADGKITCGNLPRCKADPVAANQIFTNLLDNAIKYRHRGRALAVNISGKVKGGMAVYTVSDNGAGIPEADLVKIWSVFCRPEAAPERKGEGIGLHTVKHLAEKNGGGVTVESKEGAGTAFCVRLPAVEEEKNGN